MINLIGISGYIGSGKDTVGKIIQYLDGKLKEEKSSLGLGAKFFIPNFQYISFEDWRKPKIHESGHDIGNSSMYEIHPNNWQIKKFAYKVKQIASILTGIPAEKFEDQEFKKSFLVKEWNYIKKDWEGVKPFGKEIEFEKQMTGREFLQRLGTDAIRNQLHPNTWVNALFADYKGYAVDYREKGNDGLYPKETNFPNWIITDVRFPNEAKAIKERGGVVIRVNRDECVTGTFAIDYLGNKRKSNLHESEVALDDWEFDYIINNNGTIEQLIVKVKDLLKELP